jgi:hypothetical protein
MAVGKRARESRRNTCKRTPGQAERKEDDKSLIGKTEDKLLEGS